MFIRSALALLLVAARLHAVTFAPGETVRVTKSEMLLFKGENFQPAAKGQDFTVLKHDPATRRVFVSYLKDDDSIVAVTLPDDVLELSPPNAWGDLVKAVSAFRDLRHDEAARLFQRAAQDANIKPLAGTIASRAVAARTGTPAGLKAMRDLTAHLATSGLPTLALPLDEGTDRLGNAPPTTLDRADLKKRVAASQYAFMRSRQSIARHRLVEAAKHLETGLAAEPGHVAMKALAVGKQRDLDEARGMLDSANGMRRFQKGAVHAMTAIENGLKLCADHVELRALKQEMNAQFEERTSPQITTALLSAMRINGGGERLAEGRKLYTTRCTECHDLELLDSRSMDGWGKAVAGMARRANLKDAEQASIMEYLSVAVSAVSVGVGQ